MTDETIGFIGLGNIGRPMADNLAASGLEMVVYDIAGTQERAPKGAGIGTSVGDVAARSTVIFLCLPTVEAFHGVIDEIAGADTHQNVIVTNVSTVGPSAAVAADRRLREREISLVDSPVSGGVFRAQAGELAIMYSGSDSAVARTLPLFEVIGSKLFRVGTAPGQGQRMKLVNQYLVVSAFVITSEALAFGEKGGLDLKAMLDIINASTGQSFVSEQFFPRYVLTETFDSRSAGGIILKDLSLFLEAAKAQGRKHEVAQSILDVLEEFDAARPNTDQTLLYPFVRDHR